MYVYLISKYKINNKYTRLIYQTRRIKPIKIYKSKYLYYNNVFNYNILRVFKNIYYYKINIWNFFNHTNVLLVNEFLVFYVQKYITNCGYKTVSYNSCSNTFYKSFAFIKYYSIIYYCILIKIFTKNIYYYILINKFLNLLSIYICIFQN